MSNMPGSYENTDVQMYQEPERTSILAILSLVMGVGGCCFGVTSILAVPFAIIGMVGISRSKGRVGGTGLAIAGLIVGLITLALWAGLIIGVGGAMKVGITQFGSTTTGIFSDIQGGDYDSARTAMSPPASETEDAEIAAFYTAYKADLGDFVAMPSGLGELFSGYGAVAQQMQAYNGQPGYVPMPARFDSGWVLIIYAIDPRGQASQSGQIPPPQRLILVGSDGKEYTLPADAGNTNSVNRPAGEAPADAQEDQTGDDQNADEASEQPTDQPGDETPEGP